MSDLDQIKQKGRKAIASFGGPDYLSKRDASTNAFNGDLRNLSEVCTGMVWSRPGLEPKFRSMLCIGMLAATGRLVELRTHISGAFNHGCTPHEVKEVILQSVLYTGFPAANEANRICEDVMRERGIVI